MGTRINPDGSITVGILPEDIKPCVVEPKVESQPEPTTPVKKAPAKPRAKKAVKK